MSNEVEISFGFKLLKDLHLEQYDVSQWTADQTGVGSLKSVIEVGTSEEVISYGDITTPKFCIFRNLDDTNYVVVGPESGGSMVEMIRLQPGEWGFLPLGSSVVVRAQANSSACKVLFLFTET